MIHSMTGFGKTICEFQGIKLNIEVKSLNSKQIDIYTRIPHIYKEKELEIRNLLKQKLDRGKVEFNIYIDRLEDEKTANINKSVILNYYKQLKEITGELNIEQNEQLLPAIMRLPDTVKSEYDELDEEEWEKVILCIKEAITELISFRTREGKVLEKDIIERVKMIELFLQQVEPLEKERINRIRQRLNNNLHEFISTDNFDTNRLEQEMIFYLEKLDITEEKIRLKAHCEYFLENVSKGSPIGKKLGFISQEMGREINTLGSKANDTGIQKLVIQMKDELEKIKEQLLNVL